MNKTEFLKDAKEKLKNQLEIKNKWVAEMNFVFNDSLILRVWFDHEANNRKGAYMHRWCTVDVLGDYDKNRKLIRQAGQILSGDSDKEIEKMIKILRKALKEQPDQTADYVDGITMWQNVEYSFTVKAACEYIGIE